MDKRGAWQPPDGSRIWLPELVDRFASFLHTNEVACNLRLVNKATAAHFRGRREFTTVRLSQPVPAHAFAWRWGAPDAIRSLMRSLTLVRRRKLLCLTAASGSVPNLELALEHAGFIPTSDDRPALCAAAAAGHLNTYDAVLSHQAFALDESATREAAGAAAAAAAQAGQRAVCEVLFSRGADCDIDTVCAAARGGHPDLLDWLLLRWPEGQSSALDSRLQSLDTYDRWALIEAAATGCSLQVLQDLHRRCFGGEEAGGQVYGTHAAAASPTPGWRAKVEWLETLSGGLPPPSCQTRCCTAAASCPDALARLMWLRQRGYDVNLEAADAAARAGNVAALEYLLDEGAVGQYTGLQRAAAGAGQLGALTALHARGYPMDPDAVAFEGCRGGHLAVVVWAVETLGADVRGEPSLQEAAAASGNVELMAWMRQRGAMDWSHATLDDVAASGCEEAVEWAVAQGCPMPADGEPAVSAALNGDLATLRCLRRLGCPWGPAWAPGRVFHRCVLERVRLPLLQWLAQEGCVVDWTSARFAARAPSRSGDVRSDLQDVLSWLCLMERRDRESRSGGSGSGSAARGGERG